MTNISPASPPINFVDNPHAPDVFADSATGHFVFAGNLRITFETARVNHVTTPGPINRVVIGRLVMPVHAAEEMAKGILQFLDQQRGQQIQAAQPPPTIQ